MKRSTGGVFMLAIFLAAALTGCSPALTRHEFVRPEMGTTFHVIVYCPDEKSAKLAADAAFDRIAQLNASLSDYLDDSELSRLSATAGSGKAVHVSDDLWNVLAESQRIACQTDGAFDVTIAPLVYLWRRARRTGELPDPAKIAAAKQRVDYRSVKLDLVHHTVTLTRAGTMLDLGGIAKGYAADEALALLRERGVNRALVAAAGDIAIGDPPPGRSGWEIAVDPFGELDPPKPGEHAVKPAHSALRYVLLAHAAVSTSGEVHQHVVIGGQSYSHIVNPRTGLGLTTSLTVTVIAPRATLTDALATACCIMGVEKTERVLDAMPQATALMAIENDGRPLLMQTAGASKLRFAKPRP